MLNCSQIPSLMRVPLAVALSWLLVVVAGMEGQAQHAGHTRNWAVIVSTSRYWHNYRHTANALSFYHLCRQNGIPDDRILLFLADGNVACNGRNTHPGTVFNEGNTKRRTNLYFDGGSAGCGTAEVDFSGYDVTTASFLSVLQGRFQRGVTPTSRRLLSDASSDVFVFLTGHGGDGFLKFQDTEYLHSEDLGLAFSVMYELRMYRRLLVVVETCHAESMCSNIHAPNVVCVATSKREEESFAHHYDADLGVSVIDAVVFSVLQRLNGVTCRLSTSLSTSPYERGIAHFFNNLGVAPVEASSPPAAANRFIGALRPAVNDPMSLDTWKLGDFLCGVDRSFAAEQNEALEPIPILDLLSLS